MKEPNMNNPWRSQGYMTTTLSSSEGAECINYGKTFHLVLYGWVSRGDGIMP